MPLTALRWKETVNRPTRVIVRRFHTGTGARLPAYPPRIMKHVEPVGHRVVLGVDDEHACGVSVKLATPLDALPTRTRVRTERRTVIVVDNTTTTVFGELTARQIVEQHPEILFAFNQRVAIHQHAYSCLCLTDVDCQLGIYRHIVLRIADAAVTVNARLTTERIHLSCHATDQRMFALSCTNLINVDVLAVEAAREVCVETVRQLVRT